MQIVTNQNSSKLNKIQFYLISLFIILLQACATSSLPNYGKQGSQLNSKVPKVLISNAQRITQGMTGTEVIECLGSPNIITSDTDGLDTWIYDKISREFETVTVEEGSWLFSPRLTSITSGSSSEKTLIVVIRFAADKKVRQVSYRQSSY